MEKLNNKEATALIITICLNIAVLISSQIIVESCNSAGLINSCFISIIAIIITCIICLLYKKFIGLNILDVSEFLGGKILKFIVGILFTLYFLFTIIVLLCRLANCLQIIYYPITNTVFIILVFLISTGIICNFRNNAFSKANFIIFFLSLATIALVFAGNTKNFNYQNIYPILGDGIDSIFISGISNLFTFGGIAYIFFLPSKLKSPDKFFKISILGILISSILLMIIVTIITLMFNKNLVSGELFPLYTSVRYIEFGTFFQRLDSVFLLIKVISFISFLGIYTNVILNIIKEITQITDTKPLIYPLMLLILGFCILFGNYFNFEFLQNTVFKILFFSIAIGLGIVILFFSNLKKIGQK